MTGQIPADVARDALAAVLEALDIPHAATVGEDEKRVKILERRVMHTVLALQELIGPGRIWEPAQRVGYLRERLAENPAEGCYKTWEQALTELRARQAAEAGGE